MAPMSSPGSGSREGWSQRIACTKAKARTGRFSTNNHRQSPSARRAAPISGPKIRNTVPPVENTPIAQPRRSSGITLVVLANASG